MDVHVSVWFVYLVFVLGGSADDDVTSLKQLVDKQGDMLVNLGKRIEELEKKFSDEKAINKLQSLKIDTLNAKLLKLDTLVHQETTYRDANVRKDLKLGVNGTNYRKRPSASFLNDTDNSNISNIRDIDGKRHEFMSQDVTFTDLKKRQLVPAATSSPKPPVVAFSAYMSQNERNVGVHHILTFDKVQTNTGNGYNGLTGSFVAPQAGVYVLTYTIVAHSDNLICTDLITNNVVAGHAYAFSGNIFVQQSATSVVVVHLNLGDTVYVRSDSNGNCGTIHTIYGDAYRRSTFAGWFIG